MSHAIDEIDGKLFMSLDSDSSLDIIGDFANKYKRGGERELLKHLPELKQEFREEARRLTTEKRRLVQPEKLNTRLLMFLVGSSLLDEDTAQERKLGERLVVKYE